MASENEIPDCNLMHAQWAASYVAIKEAKVSFVGCNAGEDCRNLLSFKTFLRQAKLRLFGGQRHK